MWLEDEIPQILSVDQIEKVSPSLLKTLQTLRRRFANLGMALVGLIVVEERISLSTTISGTDTPASGTS